MLTKKRVFTMEQIVVVFLKKNNTTLSSKLRTGERQILNYLQTLSLI